MHNELEAINKRQRLLPDNVNKVWKQRNKNI